LLYLVMRLLPGQSLKDRSAEGKLPAAEAARIGLECARALAAAHAVGVVHRDIKPGNILLDANGNATVTDFGIALVTSRPARELLGSTTGTPLYMSPEQSLGEHAGWAADPLAGATATLEPRRHLSRDRRGERGARDRDRRAHLIAGDGILGERRRGCRSRVARVGWCSTGFDRASRTRDEER